MALIRLTAMAEPSPFGMTQARDSRSRAIPDLRSTHHLTETEALINRPRGFALAPSYPSVALVIWET